MTDVELKSQQPETNSLPPTDDRWYSYCCGKQKIFSRSLVEYLIQCIFSLLVLLFAMYMYMSAADSGTREVWISTISTIIGLHFPNPTFKEVPNQV